MCLLRSTTSCNEIRCSRNTKVCTWTPLSMDIMWYVFISITHIELLIRHTSFCCYSDRQPFNCGVELSVLWLHFINLPALSPFPFSIAPCSDCKQLFHLGPAASWPLPESVTSRLVHSPSPSQALWLSLPHAVNGGLCSNTTYNDFHKATRSHHRKERKSQWRVCEGVCVQESTRGLQTCMLKDFTHFSAQKITMSKL